VLPQVVAEVLGRDHLAQGAGATVDLPGHQPIAQRLRGEEEAKPESGSENLRERADVDHFAWVGQRVNRPLTPRLEADIAVRVVFYDR
jgi:hypothetical protein